MRLREQGRIFVYLGFGFGILTSRFNPVCVMTFYHVQMVLEISAEHG